MHRHRNNCFLESLLLPLNLRFSIHQVWLFCLFLILLNDLGGVYLEWNFFIKWFCSAQFANATFSGIWGNHSFVVRATLNVLTKMPDIFSDFLPQSWHSPIDYKFLNREISIGIRFHYVCPEAAIQSCS